MFEFKIVTLFPSLFSGFIEASLIGKAVRNQLLSFSFIDLRDYTTDRHRSVDDTPYGGGSGMVMKTEPILKALATQPNCHKILLTPQGAPFKQSIASRLATADKPVLLFCGRYEGVDERVRGMFDEEICLGDFVLNGGETAAMAVIEAVSRLIKGVIGNENSIVEESFSYGLLEYPQYTRPEIIDNKSVPAVLLSGNHKKIDQWRRGQSLLRTQLRRKDLFSKFKMSQEDNKLLIEAQREETQREETQREETQREETQRKKTQ